MKDWVVSLNYKTMEEGVAAIFSEGARSSKSRLTADSLRKNFLDPEEVANAVLYVASALSSATNGATIRAEGGILKHV